MCRVLFVACWSLFDGCCLLFGVFVAVDVFFWWCVVSCVLFVGVCFVVCVVCCSLFVVRCLLFVVCCCLLVVVVLFAVR